MSDLLQVFIDTIQAKREGCRPLFSFWHQFPRHETSSKELAEANVDFYLKYSFDVMRISPPSNFFVIDFGCKLKKEFDEVTGFRAYTNLPIKTLEDWEEIEEFSPTEGYLGKQLDLVRIVHKKIESVPKFFPIPTPLCLASYLDRGLHQHVKQNSGLISEVLQVLRIIIEEFAEGIIAMGTNGVIVETAYFSDKSNYDWKTFINLELKTFKQILSRISHYADFIVVRPNISSLHFKKIIQLFNADCLNWNSAIEGLDIYTISNIFKGGLLTGLDQSLFEHDDKSILKESVYDIIMKAYQLKSKLIIAPNSIIPLNTPHWKLKLIGDTVKSIEKGK